MDISGLGRLLGHPRAIGEELRKSAIARGLRVQVAVAPTQTAAMLLALARPGLTIVRSGDEASALATVPVGVLEAITGSTDITPVLQVWGIRTLGEFGALPSDEVSARIGQQGLIWQRLARGEDAGPLVPTLAEERFESSLDLEWPIEGLEPLSFVLTRLLEPLSARLERRDRGVIAIHLTLGLTTRNIFTRSLQLPSPMRDVRTLRTLMLLDLEAHPPPAGIDRVIVKIEATPSRVWQHTLFARAQPEPEQLSTLVARLHALMGQDRIGRPALVDSHRPGSFEMLPFAPSPEAESLGSSVSHQPDGQFVSALRRCRRAVPARVAMAAGRPVHVTTDRRGFAGGRVLASAGPWPTSGSWWITSPWDGDEWDVSLSDGAVYRIFRDRRAGSWFIDAIVD